MKLFLITIFLLTTLIIGCYPAAGPKIRCFKKDGQQWYTSTIYAFPDGKRVIAQKDTYNQADESRNTGRYNLQESVLYYEIWPNNEIKFVSKKGFVRFKDGVYCFNLDSIRIPDNVIYKQYDTNYVEHIYYYKDGIRVPYTLGYHDNHRVMHFLRDKPGVYNWKDGKEYFEREFTEEEWAGHERMNQYLKQMNKADTTGK